VIRQEKGFKMEMLEIPQIWNKKAIIYGGKVAGYIQLVNYAVGAIPHVELKLSPKYRHKGIMSEMLPRYLQECCENKKSSRFIAVCKINNIPAHKLLEKSGFVKSLSLKGKVIYLRDLEHSVEDLQAFMKGFARLTKTC
jgi:RimJ/RimL family protein N-acetyltransferase